MEHHLVFLLGVYLVPLAFLSLVSAWAAGRRPWLALALVTVAVACIAWVATQRAGGLYALRDIPDLTVALVAQLRSLF